jgi:hypothetical protein
VVVVGDLVVGVVVAPATDLATQEPLRADLDDDCSKVKGSSADGRL